MPSPPVRTVIALFGPTGVGKTAVAIALAERLRADRGEDPIAVGADALQLYAGLELLTGAPSAAERARLEHRLVGTVPVDRPFSVGAFAAAAHREIDAALASGRRPIVVGGTGLYLRAALTDLELRPPPPQALRAELLGRLEAEGPQALHDELARAAPWAAADVAPGDRARIVRRLELHRMGALRPPDPARPSELWTARTRHPTLLAGLVMDRDALDRRIADRVAAMVAAGARAEVERAAAAGAGATARKALGFAHLLAGDVEGMERDTRRYARRQLTWMRKLAGLVPVDVTGRAADDVAGELLGRLAD